MDERPVEPASEPAPDIGPGTSEPIPESPPSPGAAPAANTGWVVPPPSDQPRRSLPIAAVIILALAIVGAIGAVVFVGSQLDPREVIARDFGERLLAIPEFKQRYGDIDTPEEAYQLGQELSRTAFSHLDDTRPRRYFELSFVMWEATTDDVCAAVLRQTVTRDEAEATVRLLSEDQFREMMDLTYLAFEAELTGAAGPARPSDDQVNAAYVALAAAMGEQTMVDTATTMTDSTASSADVCTAARAFLDAVMDLPNPHGPVLLRFMSYP